MPISAQTKTELHVILETLDQRIYELSEECSTSIPELGMLQILRDQAASLL